MSSPRELVRDDVNAVAQIFANYQAALHLFEEAVANGSGEAELAADVLRRTAHEVFEPVLDACAGLPPRLEELVADSMGKPPAEPGRGAAAGAVADLVAAERQRVAVSHSRLIRRQLALMEAAEDRAAVDVDYRRALTAAAGRLDELQTRSHTAGALFNLLFDRWLART